MIIPGRKRPDGTFVPYVTIVQKYQTQANTNIWVVEHITLSLKISLINPPSVYQNIEANGSKSFGSSHQA